MIYGPKMGEKRTSTRAEMVNAVVVAFAVRRARGRKKTNGVRMTHEKAANR